MTLNEAKKLLSENLNLLSNEDLICLYVSPSGFNDDAKFMQLMMEDDRVSNSTMIEAIKNGFFENELEKDSKSLDVYVLTKYNLGLMVNGNYMPINLSKYLQDNNK